MNDELVTVGTYPTDFEANVVKSELEAFGLHAVLQDQNMVGLNVFLTNMLGGVKVRVPQSGLDEARRILHEMEPAADEGGDSESALP